MQYVLTALGGAILFGAGVSAGVLFSRALVADICDYAWNRETTEDDPDYEWPEAKTDKKEQA